MSTSFFTTSPKMAVNTTSKGSKSLKPQVNSKSIYEPVQLSAEKKTTEDFATEHKTGGWREGMDHRVDNSDHSEFGGSFGTLAIIIGSPLLMYYLWIGATYYDGQFPVPEKGQSLGGFGKHLGGLIYVSLFKFNCHSGVTSTRKKTQLNLNRRGPSPTSEPGRSTGHITSSKLFATSSCPVLPAMGSPSSTKVVRNLCTTIPHFQVSTSLSS